MVLLIIIPFLNGYFIGNIPYFQTNSYQVIPSFLQCSWSHWTLPKIFEALEMCCQHRHLQIEVKLVEEGDTHSP